MKRLRRTLGVLALLAPCAAAPGEAREGKDLYGDPVPAGAVRLGTSRLREGRVISRIAFSLVGQLLPPLADTVLHGRNGLLVPQRDSKALADAIESILADGARCEQMSRESVQWAEHQSWRNVAARMRAFYEKVLG
jgi:hypothetical protein